MFNKIYKAKKKKKAYVHVHHVPENKKTFLKLYQKQKEAAYTAFVLPFLS